MLETNKGKFKVYTPAPKSIQYKKSEIKSNLAKLFLEKFNTSKEESETLYKQTHEKEVKTYDPRLKILKPKKKESMVLL